MTVENRRLVPLDDVAETLSVTRRTVERLIAADELRSVQIGRRRFCTLSVPSEGGEQ